MAVLFDDVTVITMNAQREILTGAAVAVAADRIAALGSRRELAAAYPRAERIDGRGMVLMPGLVDTHVHTAQAMIRGCADDLGLLDWLGQRVWVLQGNYSAEDGRASAALCALEMIKSGTTTFLECMLAERYGFDGVAEVVLQSGLRAAIAKIVMDLPSYARVEGFMHPGMVEDGPTSVANTLAAHARWEGAGDGRLQVWFGPRTPGGATLALYDQIGALARERGMGITIHLSEVREDLEYAAAQGFRSPAELARAHGLLGPRTVLAHCVWTDAADWRLFVETGTSVTHNPASNAKCGSGTAPIHGMLQAGVNVSLGCDGGPSNNAYDMIRDLRLASYIANTRESDPTVVPAEAVLEMATLGGARALGLQDEIGSIEPGKKADFILIDMDAPHLTPCWDPVSTIAYAACGMDVDTVVIDGRIVMQGRKVCTLDETAVVAEARRRAGEVARRAGLEIGPRWPVRAA